MPRRELKYPHQVEEWLMEMGRQVTQPGQMILIGSGGLLWHAAQRGIEEPLPETQHGCGPDSPTQMKSRAFAIKRLLGVNSSKLMGWHVKLGCQNRCCASFRWIGKTARPQALTATARHSAGTADLLIPKSSGANREIAHMSLGKARRSAIDELCELIRSNESEDTVVWGPYPNYDDIARLNTARRLLEAPNFRARFLKHWLD